MTGNQYAEVEVTSIEKNDPYHTVTINGGIEQEGGLDLILMDGSEYYRTITFDDYPVYYEVGETELSLADDVVLKDSSADPQADAVETTRCAGCGGCNQCRPGQLDGVQYDPCSTGGQNRGSAPHLGAVRERAACPICQGLSLWKSWRESA